MTSSPSVMTGSRSEDCKRGERCGRNFRMEIFKIETVKERGKKESKKNEIDQLVNR